MCKPGRDYKKVVQKYAAGWTKAGAKARREWEDQAGPSMTAHDLNTGGTGADKRSPHVGVASTSAAGGQAQKKRRVVPMRTDTPQGNSGRGVPAESEMELELDATSDDEQETSGEEQLPDESNWRAELARV